VASKKSRYLYVTKQKSSVNVYLFIWLEVITLAGLRVMSFLSGSSREEVQQGFRLDKNKSCQLSSTNNKVT
jgi:hypothetical protein